MRLVGLFGPVIDGHRVQERMKGGIKFRSRLLPRVVNVNNVQRSDMGSGMNGMSLLSKAMANPRLLPMSTMPKGVTWRCPSMIPIPEIRQEVLLRCRCLKGLWGTVDKDAVELLQDNLLGDVAMLSKMTSSEDADKLRNGETASKKARIGGINSLHVDGCLGGVVGIRSISSCKVKVNAIILPLESKKDANQRTRQHQACHFLL
jgi:hypothetical protein